MIHPADTESPRQLWLDMSIRRILGLPKEVRPRPGVEGLAIQLLRSIEADELPVPTVCVTDIGSIRLGWKYRTRTLTVFVRGGGEYRFEISSMGFSKSICIIRKDHVEEMRKLIAWLYPGTNSAHAGEV